MNHSLKRLGIVLLACMGLMSFKMERPASDGERLLYDVRAAFVVAKPDVSADIMQSVQYQISSAIDATRRERMRTRVVLTIRLISVTQRTFLFGERTSAKVSVRAAAVQTGEVIAEANFTATIVGMNKGSQEDELANGIADRVIREFSLSKPAPSTLATALFPWD
jgi:hypothetical protein